MSTTTELTPMQKNADEQINETYALFSVENGKFHKPAGQVARSHAWQPLLTVCGATVTPHNYFKSEEDANGYTGGRLSAYICKRCERYDGADA